MWAWLQACFYESKCGQSHWHRVSVKHVNRRKRGRKRTSIDELVIVLHGVCAALLLVVGSTLRSYQTGYIPQIDTYDQVILWKEPTPTVNAPSWSNQSRSPSLASKIPSARPAMRCKPFTAFFVSFSSCDLVVPMRSGKRSLYRESCRDVSYP